jgi:thymidine phosphorylase
VIHDIVENRYSKMEIAAFLIASARFLTTDEVLALTRAMAAAGTRIEWSYPLVVDKHSIGGIPGNRTSMIVVPIVAAHGLVMPKTSSRAITSPAGTADTMEVLARVDLGMDEMRAVVERAKGCLVWGGHVNLSPADDILISVERPLGIDTREQMVASILSKKLAAGSTHLVIDIPVGPSAKVRNRTEAVALRKLFEWVGDQLGLTLDVVTTDAYQPIGRGIGPVLEARDVMDVLRCAPNASRELREKSLLLAGRIIDFDVGIRGGMGLGRARELLDSGAALAAMERIIEAQGPSPERHKLGSLVREISAPADGVVAEIDCYRLARIARLAGAPLDKGAGIDMLSGIGDKVRQGEPFYRIHAVVPADFGFASDLAAEDSGIRIAGS